MVDTRLTRAVSHLTSVLTGWFPRGGARLLDAVVAWVLGNRALIGIVDRRNRAAVRRLGTLDRILVVPDIHIGDAVMMQGVVAAFRDLFPAARIDYVVKRDAACLIEGNPDISTLYPLFTGTTVPVAGDVEAVRALVLEQGYDLCFNCSPYLDNRRAFPRPQRTLDMVTAAPQIVRNEIDEVGVNHFVFQGYGFPMTLFSRDGGRDRRREFAGVTVTLSDAAVEEAKRFLDANRLAAGERIVFLNPDTASPYTFIPVEHQRTLLGAVAAMGARILLGSGFAVAGIEARLLSSLPADARAAIVTVPTSLPLDGYAALLDASTVFISGDTGPLHIAAARKVSRSGRHVFRNATSVISLFGATPPRMSGYDSTSPLFPPANQDAPSRTYVAASPCRNLTCVNKMAKTCQQPRCFDDLPTARIIADIGRYLGNGAQDRRSTGS